MRGKVVNAWIWSRNIWDHPRLCGEKFISRMKKQLLSGSPPPMRGKAEMSENRGFIVGITPAYAGKSGNFRGC